MKSLFYSVFVTLLFSLSAFAQNEGINFQGVARNAAGEVLVSQKINLRLSILLGSETGAVAYMETRQATTNPQGVFAVVVGDALALTKSTNFSSINWTPAAKFIKVEMDPNAGTNYLVMGTSRLQAVPFAFHAYGVDAANVKGVLPVASGGTGVASISELKTTLGLDQVNNSALDSKVDKVAGKELSTNDYTTAEKSKLAAITGSNTGDQDLSSYATIAMVNAIDVTSSLASGLATKVDKVTGKGLSTNDYTTAEKTKLAAITGTNTGDQDLSSYATTAQLATKANSSDVTTSLATKANASDVTTSLATKANASDVTTSLATKVDKVTGKGLSTNDYSTAEKDKLAAITGTNTGDQVNITGNAGTATKLQTARTINGVSFDGSANITLPAAAAGIPYTGATEAVDLGAFNLKVNGITIGRGRNLTTDSNLGVGRDMLNSVTSGSYNTAIGADALRDLTTGYNNLAIGANSQRRNIGGIANTAIGVNALQENQYGLWNVAIGNHALRYNTASDNAAIGSGALEFNTTGIFNTAFGKDALKNNSVGSNNTSVGLGALSNSVSNNNTAMGTNSLKNTTGYSNTALGNAAGEINTTGNENTAIGATATFGANNLSNATAVGFGATASASNSVRLGNASVTVIGGQVAWTAASDSRIKKNIVNSTYGLATVLKLRPVEYNLTSNDLKQVGFIAQEVQKLVPEVVTGKEGDLSKGEILGITYSNLVPVLTKAIQEQQKQIEDQNAKIAAQQKQIEELIKLVKGQ
jgi:trimeric autotransporter adhesin